MVFYTVSLYFNLTAKVKSGLLVFEAYTGGAIVEEKSNPVSQHESMAIEYINMLTEELK